MVQVNLLSAIKKDVTENPYIVLKSDYLWGLLSGIVLTASLSFLVARGL
jgi:hypothetical protein